MKRLCEWLRRNFNAEGAVFGSLLGMAFNNLLYDQPANGVMGWGIAAFAWVVLMRRLKKLVPGVVVSNCHVEGSEGDGIHVDVYDGQPTVVVGCVSERNDGYGFRTSCGPSPARLPRNPVDDQEDDDGHGEED